MGFIIGILLMLFFGVIFSTPILLFDALVRQQYKNHHEDWVIDGKPDCYLWRIEAFAWKRNWEAASCLMKWLRKTPEWMSNDPKALKLVFWLRFSYYSILCLWLIGVIFAILYTRSKSY